MHPDLARLMSLQKLDLEAKRLRDELLAVPKQVAALETKARATVGQRAVVLDLIAKEEVLRRRQESDVEDQRARIKRARARVESATTTVQVNSLEHEIQFAEKEIAQLEDAELETMMRAEELDKQRKLADKAVAESEAAFATARDRSVDTLARDRAALTAVDGQRAAERKTIGETALSLYDRIAKSKGTGIAEALGQKCTACQMLLRPQKWNDLRERDNEEMMTCESCGRLLYYDPARDSPQRKTVEPVRTESIAAQIVRGG